MAAHKGHKKMGGRAKGTLNKSTVEVKAAAAKYGPDAIKKLAQLMDTADTDQAKIAACKEILDRAYGKAPQAITGEDGKALFPKHIKLTIVDPRG